jgi:2-oxoglutarate ferredoxin oxidoreductase subunit delta
MARKILQELRIKQDWCKGCRICVRFCPKGVLTLDKHEKAYAAHPEACNCCQLCEFRCPDLAIEVIFNTQQKETTS